MFLSVAETIVGSLLCYCGEGIVQYCSIFFIYVVQFPGREVGRTPLCKPYRYMPPHRVGFLRRFGPKTGADFTHFGLESGMVFEGTTGVYERIYCFNSK